MTDTTSVPSVGISFFSLNFICLQITLKHLPYVVVKLDIKNVAMPLNGFNKYFVIEPINISYEILLYDHFKT